MTNLVRRIAMMATVALAAFALLTSFEIASAHPQVPPGCWQTSSSSGCNRCGFLWLSTHSWTRVNYACPDGYKGSLYESSPCDGSCQ